MLLTGYDLSLSGLLIQGIGVLTLALMFLLLYRILPRHYFYLWGWGWASLSAALFSLYVALQNPPFAWAFEMAYFFGEYAFLCLLYFGLRLFPNVALVWHRRAQWTMVAALFFVLFYAVAFDGFEPRYQLHAAVFSAGLLPLMWRVSRLPVGAGSHWVKRGLFLILGLLFCQFLFNALGEIKVVMLGNRWYTVYTAYQSIADLMLESLLAFALLTMAAVDMKSTLERANQALQGERDRMVMLAHQDALTGCFNRLALDELEQRLHDRRGVVAMIDLNNLKPINDHYGHAVGDVAICRVAHGLQNRMRGHDHVFRYGGDEFLVVAFTMSRTEMQQRLQRVEQQLQQLRLAGLPEQGLSVAWGIAEFDSNITFHEALKHADHAMYEHKHLARHVNASVDHSLLIDRSLPKAE